MGSAAKIVLVGAASLVIGIYSVSLKRVQTNDLTTSISQAKLVQMEKIEDQALRTSLYRVEHNRDSTASVLNVAGTRTLMGGGSYAYSFVIPKDQYINIWGTVGVKAPNADSTIMDVKIDKVYGTNSTGVGTKPGGRRFVRGQWQITQVFVRPTH